MIKNGGAGTWSQVVPVLVPDSCQRPSHYLWFPGSSPVKVRAQGNLNPSLGSRIPKKRSSVFDQWGLLVVVLKVEFFQVSGIWWPQHRPGGRSGWKFHGGWSLCSGPPSWGGGLPLMLACPEGGSLGLVL